MIEDNEEETYWQSMSDVVQSEEFKKYILLLRYNGLIKDSKNEFERQKIYRQFYNEIKPDIEADILKGHQRISGAIDWWPYLTPIEEYTYMTIKGQGVPGFYPQYPLLNYLVDFGNPYIRVAIEADGKDYHITANDRIRDQKIYKETGWRIYRVTGSEANRVLDIPSMYEDEYNYEEWKIFLMDTVEGVVRAIRTIYFDPYEPDTEIGEEIYGLYYETLDKHRLANFDI